MGVILLGASPLYFVPVSFLEPVYQMKFQRKRVRGDGYCGEVTDRGEEACEDDR